MAAPRQNRPRDPRANGIRVFGVPGLPEFTSQHNVEDEIVRALRRARVQLLDGDAVIVAQKVVSKTEGRVIPLTTVKPSIRARQLARVLGKDARFVELILQETKTIIRKSPRVLIVETHRGFICANAGVDLSNVPGEECAALLPRDPDRSARRIARRLRRLTGKRLAVLISDTFGRPWRMGLVNVALGAAGILVLNDLRGSVDRNRKMLHATIIGIADELAAAAGLLMQKSSGTPVVIVRGASWTRANDHAARLLRPKKDDLFR
jgi:coenzyme F420-0:L-glutamate ligase/coenzyme F420-1:gamma-L-glutamate ligase